MLKDTVIIVDPFSTGALIAPELAKKGIKCYAVLSSTNIPKRFTESYTGEGFIDKTLYSSDNIANIVKPTLVIAVIAGAETGVYCAEKLATLYDVAKNNSLTTDWRRKKSEMQRRLAETGLKSISSKRITQHNTNIDDLNSNTGYVIKPDNSCGTDNVVFADNKQEAIQKIAQIKWDENNFAGLHNDFYLVQEKLDGEEFVVDLVVGRQGIKVCTLCKYKKGLHNGSYFVYESLEVLDINDPNYSDLLDYAKKVSIALGVEFGLAHLEIMNTKNGPILIELGARLHGGIAPLVFEKCYSPGLLESAVNLLTEQFDTKPATLIRKARIVFLINEEKHLSITDIDTLSKKLKTINKVEHVKLFINRHEEIPLTTELSNCPGIISLIADTDLELDTAENMIKEIFNKKNLKAFSK